MKKIFNTLVAFCLFLSAFNLSAAEEEVMGPSLFERIGGETVVRQIVADTWANHTSNPIVKNRFANSDPVYVKQKVYEIFANATGAKVEYTGKAMDKTHATMNISDMEFNAVVDDVLAAMAKNKVGQQETNEVLAILWSVKPSIVNGNLTTKSLTATK